MLAFLAGVPGRLKTLVDRLTSTRAANLDNLDAAVSTRAPASTALSTVQWTNTLATNLTTASTGAVPFTGIINSIQSGEITIVSSADNATATITSVSTSKAVVLFLGTKAGADIPAEESKYTSARVELTNSTTVTARRNSAGGTLRVGYTVLEFK